MAGEFPVSFLFEAFENVSKTLSKISGKMEELGSVTNGFNSKFQVAQKSTEHLREKLEGVGEKITTVGEIMSVGITAPLALLKHHFLEVGIEATESAGKFEQVFKNVDEAAKATAIDDLRKKFGLSTASAQEMLATTGIFTKNLGFSQEASLKMGSTVSQLAVQMASFAHDGSTAADMAQTLQMALVGNDKGLKKLGITVSDTEIYQAALAAAQRGVRFETVEQAKAAAKLEVIQRKSGDAAASFAHESEGLANQQRIGKELFKEIGATIGRILEPAALRNLKILNGIQKAFLEMSPAGQKFVVTIATIAAAIGPVLIVIGKLTGSVIPAMITGWSALTAVTWAGIAPWLLWIGAIAAVIAIGYLLYSNWDKIKTFFVAFWDGPLGSFIKFFTPLGWLIQAATAVYENWAPIKEFFGGIWDWVGQKIDALMPKIQWMIDIAKRAGTWLLFGDKGSPFAGQGGAAPTAAGGEGVGAQANNIQSQAQQIGQGIVKEMRQTNDARVQIDFSNLPRGANISSSSTGISPLMNLGMMGSPL